MKRMRTIWMGAVLGLSIASSIAAASGKIVKTLPHYLDLEGRHTLHPSLFERDMYQSDLKQHPEKCSGLRFDVQWKARGLTASQPRLRLEVKAANLAPRQVEMFEQVLPSPGILSKWNGVAVAGADFKRIGRIQAWRLTLWDGEQMLAEQKSFLW